MKLIHCIADSSPKLQLMTALLTKANHQDMTLNMTSILLELKEPDKNIKTELNKRDKNSITNLSQIQYAEVYTSALIAYVELYHIKDVRSVLVLNRKMREGSVNISSEPFQLTTNDITALQKSSIEMKKRRKLSQKPIISDELGLVSQEHVLKSKTYDIKSKIYDIIKQENELGSLKKHFKHLFAHL